MTEELYQEILDSEYDVYCYYGQINRHGYHQLSETIEIKTSLKEKVCLILCTVGGDPDAGFRMARALNHYYNSVEILIPDICKSAGTLVCIGAHKLIFGDRGELGPLDIQISKPDEMFESMSGLNIAQAINALQNETLEAFRSYLVDIRTGSKISTKMAADIATKMAEGFIKPIAGKIDPIMLGEHQRAMTIAIEYGERLNKMTESLHLNGLNDLVARYPSHNFVIDRREARELFKQVEKPSDIFVKLYYTGRLLIDKGFTGGLESPFILDLSSIQQPEDTQHHEESETTNQEDRENEETGHHGDPTGENAEDQQHFQTGTEQTDGNTTQDNEQQ